MEGGGDEAGHEQLGIVHVHDVVGAEHISERTRVPADSPQTRAAVRSQRPHGNSAARFRLRDVHRDVNVKSRSRQSARFAIEDPRIVGRMNGRNVQNARRRLRRHGFE